MLSGQSCEGKLISTPNEAIEKLLEGSQSAICGSLSTPPGRLIAAYRVFYEIDSHLRSSVISESGFFYSFTVEVTGRWVGGAQVARA
jgi:hypothetical protein